MVIILGMHRSGTSSLAGSLQQSGLYLGKVFEWNKFNLKGNRENADIMRLNDAVLEESHGAWNSPPQSIGWNQELAGERDRIIDSFREQPLEWGFKDPRTILTLPFWQDAMLPITYVATFRNPISVANSLFNRSAMPISKGLGLWKTYNEKLLSYYQEFKFPIVSFDVNPEVYQTSVRRICRYLNLPGEKHLLNDPFFDNALRKQSMDDVPELPEDIRRLYDALRQIHEEQES